MVWIGSRDDRLVSHHHYRVVVVIFQIGHIVAVADGDDGAVVGNGYAVQVGFDVGGGCIGVGQVVVGIGHTMGLVGDDSEQHSFVRMGTAHGVGGLHWSYHHPGPFHQH